MTDRIKTRIGGMMAVFDIVLAVAIGVVCTPIVLVLMLGHGAFVVIPRNIKGVFVSLRHGAAKAVRKEV